MEGEKLREWHHLALEDLLGDPMDAAGPSHQGLTTPDTETPTPRAFPALNPAYLTICAVSSLPAPPVLPPK